jgi:hypothetical protein
MSGAKRGEETEGWRKLNNKEVHNCRHTLQLIHLSI